MFSFAWALLRAAMTSCRWTSIWRAAAAGVLGMNKRYQIAGLLSKGKSEPIRRLAQ
ncbi:hypothetical protein L288_10070 [Sphingobium quisquiliarum P25]|uniref:Uncharacterized protein n=1 Tax=Sphingobium quisquiliarum P25 TaxID=1329909 RepID=T0GT35_9SPHN|nr:hypothetical protein L288_10070 [Sphingobium quisquiliarum P25]